jgi:hypothetical protein
MKKAAHRTLDREIREILRPTATSLQLWSLTLLRWNALDEKRKHVHVPHRKVACFYTLICAFIDIFSDSDSIALSGRKLSE